MRWRWTCAGPGFEAKGFFTTGDAPDAEGFYPITGVTGEANGVAIVGLQPAKSAIPGNEGWPVDNLGADESASAEPRRLRLRARRRKSTRIRSTAPVSSRRASLRSSPTRRRANGASRRVGIRGREGRSVDGSAHRSERRALSLVLAFERIDATAQVAVQLVEPAQLVAISGLVVVNPPQNCSCDAHVVGQRLNLNAQIKAPLIRRPNRRAQITNFGTQADEMARDPLQIDSVGNVRHKSPPLARVYGSDRRPCRLSKRMARDQLTRLAPLSSRERGQRMGGLIITSNLALLPSVTARTKCRMAVHTGSCYPKTDDSVSIRQAEPEATLVIEASGTSLSLANRQSSRRGRPS